MVEKLYDYYNGDKKPQTLGEIFDPATKWKSKTVAGKTIHEYIGTWNRNISGHPICNRKLSQITVKMWKDFYKDLCTDQHLTYKQVQDVRNVIAYIMAYCLEEELIKYNTARDVDYSDLPYAKSTKSKGKIKKTPFTLTQTPKVMAWCDEQLKNPKINPLHPLGIKLGIKMADRYGELRGLRWEDIDLVNQTITVRDQMVQTYVLNDDLTTTYQGRLAAGHIKGHEEVETLPLPSDAVAILKQIQSMNLDDEYVFPAGHFRSNTFNDKIKAAATSIGLNGKLYSSHSLRTTAATNLYQKTHDIYQVQRLLHHTTVEMTMKYIKDLELNEKLRENLEYDFDEDEKLQ